MQGWVLLSTVRSLDGMSLALTGTCRFFAVTRTRLSSAWLQREAPSVAMALRHLSSPTLYRFPGVHARLRRLLDAVQRFVDLTRHPELVQEHGQFPGHGDYRSPLCIFAASGGQAQSPPPKPAIGGQRTEDILCALHQQPAKMTAARLGNAQLRRTVCFRQSCVGQKQ